MELQVGDKVVRKDNSYFRGGLAVQTVERIQGNPGGPDRIVWFKESGTWHYEQKLNKVEVHK